MMVTILNYAVCNTSDKGGAVANLNSLTSAMLQPGAFYMLKGTAIIKYFI